MEEEYVGATLNFLRMNKTDFDLLLCRVESSITKRDTNMRQAITAQERLLITLRYLATGESYTSLQYLFRVSKRSIGRFVPEVCRAIIHSLREYVRLPSTSAEWLHIAQEFETRWNFPHAIGAVDGKHVPIQSPKHSGSEFFNYKGFYSIVLLAVCNANYEVIYADVGCQGRVSDGGVFKNCSLYPLLENKSLNIPGPQTLSTSHRIALPFVLLGDKAFAMTDYLIRPFAGNHAPGSIERVFNQRHSAARSTIENVFGIMTKRFRVLVGPIQLEPELARLVVMTTVYLHNYIRTRNSDSEQVGEGDMAIEPGQEGSSSLIDLAGVRIRSSNQVMAMRMRFANYFSSV
uniref:DDE Tnp4 domain-containing protein n=1 Tax=Anopheles funestus TaxID=62324 RepID=A0A182S0C8_ANOFN